MLAAVQEPFRIGSACEVITSHIMPHAVVS
jgi:hypothetical protein